MKFVYAQFLIISLHLLNFIGMRTKQVANRKQKEREAEERHRQELAARAIKKRRTQASSSSTQPNVPRKLSKE